MGINRFLLISKEIGFNEKIYPTSPVIYKIVNTINNKIYIGQTISFRKRLNQHYHALINNRHSSEYLQKSVNKHGIYSFYVEIIEVTTKELLCEREAFWIETLNCFNRDVGYNILINTPSPWYGKRTKEHCLNISKGLTGKHPSEETRRKQSLARIGRFRGKESSIAKEVLQYDKNMNLINEYCSITEAAKSIGRCHGCVDNCLSGRSKTAGGYIFKYKEII